MSLNLHFADPCSNCRKRTMRTVIESHPIDSRSCSLEISLRGLRTYQNQILYR